MMAYGQDSTQTLFIRKKDVILINVHFDNLINTPTAVQTSITRPSISWFWMYDLNYKNTNFSIASGIGFSTKRFVTNITDWKNITTNALETQNKLKLKYIDCPIELRFIKKRSLNKIRPGYYYPNLKNGVTRIALGLDFGVLVISKTETKNSFGIKKDHGIDALNKYKADITFRIGYGRINFSSSYSLISIAKNIQNNKLTPLSFGITFVIF